MLGQADLQLIMIENLAQKFILIDSGKLEIFININNKFKHRNTRIRIKNEIRKSYRKYQFNDKT